MEYREFGNTGIKVSVMGFGCGDVGGLIVRGTVQDRLEAVQRALDLGITYFDTAALYGRGQSEINLGAALRQLRAAPVVGTKVRLQLEDLTDLKGGVFKSVENSLARLGRDHVHLIQLHNSIGSARVAGQTVLTPEDAFEVQDAFTTLQTQGKVSAWGLTAVGETEPLHTIINSGRFNTAQSPYNLLNPSQSGAIPSGYPYQDYNDLVGAASSKGMGIIAIRVLAAGALSATAERHELASQSPPPIGSGANLVDDVAVAQKFSFLWEEGYTDGAVEAAIRFVITNRGVSTALVGLSSMEQLEYAAAAAEKGPLPGEAMERLQAIWESLAD
jgi:L-galactose dehydrogenase/L-glyceraldehyde 3-phosphate reductase